MEIRLKRAYEPAAEDDGVRILTERLWPRGVSKERAQIDHWVKQWAPSPELRQWYGHQPVKWPEFQRRYRAELAKHGETFVDWVDWLRSQGQVTFVYGSKGDNISSVVLREVVVEICRQRFGHESTAESGVQ